MGVVITKQRVAKVFTVQAVMLTICLLTDTSVRAATYWVSKSGSDSNTCINSTTSLTTTAKLTIAAGLACLKGGDTLYIRAGTYVEAIRDQIPAGISATQPTVVSGYLSEMPVLRALQSQMSLNHSVQVWKAYTKVQKIEVDNINGASDGSCFWLGSEWGGGGSQTLDGIICRNVARDGIVVKGSNVTIRNSQIFWHRRKQH